MKTVIGTPTLTNRIIKRLTEAIGPILIMGVISVAFVLFNSYSTSPFYLGVYECDSAIFQTVGRYWTKGLLPYRDLFDHKGPFLFAANALGYRIMDSRYGVCVIQCLFMMAVSTIQFMIYRRLTEGQKWQLIGWTAFTLLWLSVCYNCGNLSEEYCLPFLILSVYGAYDWTQNRREEINHKCGWALVYGITIGSCLMTRATNAIGVCLAVAVISIYLIFSKRYMNLVKNGIALLSGLVISVAPFVFYFATKGAMKEMLFGTILYNIQYAKDANTLFEYSFVVWAKCVFSFAPIVVLLFVGIAALFRKEIGKGIMYCAVSAPMILMFLLSAAYTHYYMIAIPYVFIDVIEIRELMGLWKFKYKAVFARIVLIGMILVLAIGVIRNKRKYATDSYRDIYQILEVIPQDERNSFMAYQSSEAVYLDMNITPGCPYFIFQDWQGYKSEELKEKIHSAYEELRFKWILSPKQKMIISDILDAEYSVCAEKEVKGVTYQLWRIIEK